MVFHENYSFILYQTFIGIHGLYSVLYFHFYVGYATDPKNSERRITEVDQFSPGLSREYLIKGFDDKDVQAYFKLMINMAVMLGADKDAAEKEMEDALKLELKLAEFALPREKRRNKTALYNPMPLKYVQDMYPEIPLVKYINDIYNSVDCDIKL